uniref:transcription factor MYB1-like n=1 Tax=Erigeron canadensis TaxID=72917 RepID=UPI001CB89B80|nr:transcription factor MYB1-like [Erigeron canadensis]
MAEKDDESSQNNKIKGSWSPKEDATLVSLVGKHGARNWSSISCGIPGRSGKSCRLRWCNQLSPNVEHGPFTPQEDDVIIRAHEVHGNKWATISRLLRGRTDNAIKNHWNSTLRHRAGSNSASTKRSFGDVSNESIQSDETGSKRHSPVVLVDSNGPETLLSLMPPGEMMVVEGQAENKVVEVALNDDKDDKWIAGIDDTCLMSIMKRMIAKEVQTYINSLWAKEDFGFTFQPTSQKRK